MSAAVLYMSMSLDGFVAGDRAAITLLCTTPTGEQILTNAICELRDGRISRWDAVAAWDEIGFGGPAYPRGYLALNHGAPDPWEPREVGEGASR